MISGQFSRVLAYRLLFAAILIGPMTTWPLAIAHAQGRLKVVDPESFRGGIVAVMLQADGKIVTSGSGYILDKRGRIVTNRHLIAPEMKIDNRRSLILVGVPTPGNLEKLEYFQADVVFAPPPRDKIDVAMIQIAAKDGREFAVGGQLMPLTGLPAGVHITVFGYPSQWTKQPKLERKDGSFAKPFANYNDVLIAESDIVADPGISGGPVLLNGGAAIGTFSVNRNSGVGMIIRYDAFEVLEHKYGRNTRKANPPLGPLSLSRLRLSYPAKEWPLPDGPEGAKVDRPDTPPAPLDRYRFPLPAPDMVEQATAKVREAYADQYQAAKNVAEKCEIAKIILEEAERDISGSPLQFAKFKVGCHMASILGAPDLVAQALDQQRWTYNLDIAENAAKAISKLADTTPKKQQSELAKVSLRFLQTAISTGQLAAARQIVAVATSAAREAREAELVQSIRIAEQELELLERQFAELQPHLEKLKSNPDDPEANLVVGRFQVFTAGNWTDGAKHLSRCSDKALKALGEQELASDKSRQQWLVLADGWWEIAQQEKSSLSLKYHIAKCYRQVQVKIGETDGRTRADERLRELPRNPFAPRAPKIAEGRRAPRIPPDAKVFRSHSYYIFEAKGDRAAAILHCRELGGYLAMVDDGAENQFLRECVKTSKAVRTAQVSPWVDGSNNNPRKVWLYHNGKPLRYTNWNPLVSLKEVACASLEADGTWLPSSASMKCPFICEWDSVAPAANRR